METLKQYLQEHPFFEGLPENDVDLLVGCAKNVRFETGAQIFREGEKANQFFILRHGRVAIDIYSPGKGNITVETLDAGEVFGWSWLVPPFCWNFDARVIELTRAVAMDAECLRKKLKSDPRLGYEMFKRFAKVMTQRLQAQRVQLLDVYSA